MADRFDVGSARNVVLGIGKVSPALFVSSRERPAVGFMAGSRQAPGPLKVERELLRLSGDDGRDTAPPRRRRGELHGGCASGLHEKKREIRRVRDIERRKFRELPEEWADPAFLAGLRRR